MTATIPAPAATPERVAAPAAPWVPVLTGGDLVAWTRDAPGGGWLTAHPAPGGQRWQWEHRAPARHVPTIVAAAGHAATDTAATLAADAYLTTIT